MKEMKRFLSLVLCLAMIVGLLPMSVFAANDTVIDAAIFASDVHGKDTNTDASSVKNVFSQIAGDSDLAKASSANFVGDTQMAQATVTSVAQTALGNTSLVCNYAYGSHDTEGGASIEDVTGFLYDNDNYYVYAISQTDMQSASNASSAASAFASEIEGLTDKTKPMFILTHMPLHAGRNDNAGAASWFSAIQTAAASMDIVVFWGHNHTEENKGNTTTADRAAYYVAKDGSETLDVYNGTPTVPGFTYMNAGYIGRTESAVGRAGVATTVKLYADRMVFQDYNSSGAYSGDYAHNETVYFEFADLSDDTATETTLTGISISGTTEYTVGDALDLTVTASYSDGTSAAVEAELTGYDMSTAGDYTVTATYESLTATIDITVKAAEVKDVSYITISEGTTVYTVGDKLTFTVFVYHTDGTSTYVDQDACEITCSCPDGHDGCGSLENMMNVVAYDTDYHQVKITYGGKDTTYSFTVGDPVELTDKENNTGVKVYVFDGVFASITAAESANTYVASAMETVGLNDYMAYDVTPANALKGGNYAKVSLPVPEDWNENALVAYYVPDNGDPAEKLEGEYADGYYTFTVDHFSTYVVGQELTDVPADGWVTMPSTSYVLDTDGVDVGGQYLIVAASSSYAMTNSISSNAAGRYAVTISDDGKTVTADSTLANYVWTFSGSTSGTIMNGSSYLRRRNSTNLSLSSQSTTWTISSNGDGTYSISNSGKNDDYYLYYSSSSFSLSTSSNTVRLYKYTEGNGGVAGIAGATEYSVDLNSTADAALNAVKAGITGYYGATSDTAAALDDSDLTWEWVDTFDGTTPGSYTVSISYNGTQLGTVEVKVVERTATSIDADEMSGSVRINSGSSATTGTKLTVIYEDNTTATVDVTVGMLTDAEGNAVSTATQGTYTNLTITYGGKTITGYTLVVNPIGGDNYPEYPKEGAVRVDKVSDGSQTDFQSTGVVNVQLSTTGVPYKGNGIDVIVVLDWTDSMDESIGSGSDTRKTKTVEATRAFIKEIMIDSEGNLTGNNVLIYVFESSSVWQVKLNSSTTTNAFETVTSDMLSGLSGDDIWAQMDTFLASKITTSTVASGSTISVSKDLTNCTQTVTDSNSSSGGTTYGTPLAAVYNKFANTTYAEGEERTQYCVFMSDGAPTSKDYYGIVSETQNATTGAWSYNYGIYTAATIRGWVDGTDVSDVKKELFSTRAKRELGVTFFSVGLGVDSVDGVSNYDGYVDDSEYLALASEILGNIASEPTTEIKQTLFTVTDEDAGTGGLATAFETIAASIRQAGTNAYFVDTMGDNFDLQMNPTVTNKNGNSATVPTDITVSQYTLIKRSQIGDTITLNGESVTVTEAMVGTRTGESSVLETVSFSVAADGTISAYSSVIGSTTNILVNGVICADTFWYNTTATDVQIDTNGDGTNDYTLPAETFYWGIGTITESEVVLSYYVYLSGAVEGEREAGDSYETNKSAVLHYTNYLGNSAYKDTVSPVVAWESAVVSYAFYLVDASSGLPITNVTTGATGSFADSVKVTIPAVYKTVLLNNDETVTSILASDVLLEGYELYDTAAQYTITIDTLNAKDSGWSIVQGTSNIATTYVTSYGGDPTNDTSVTGADGTYDFTNTVVYFAVKFQIQTINDAVVVDYGLPVDITVMGNDMFGNNGKLVSVGSAIPDDVDNSAVGTGNFIESDVFNGASSVTTNYGSATVNVTSEDSYFDGYVRYTPGTMNFIGVDKVAYCVQYTDPDPQDINFGDVTGYYYGEISVIPATTVYYEDNFTTSDGGSYITYSGFTRTQNEDGTYSAYASDDSIWTNEGTAITGVTQAEDRPGAYNQTYIDANNVYGYDAAYDNMTEWSMGSAKKIHVDATQYGTAEFTFTGTGFDVISMTDSTTGTLVVQVYDSNNTRIKSIAVDTYYGYTYQDGTWVQVDTAGEGVMQVPVMQISGLTYGQYTVKISALYYGTIDQTTADGYDLYLDAIRIYDPVQTSVQVSDKATVETVYKQDAEGWPIYQELRDNLIEAATLNSESGVTEVNGIVFIDGVGESATLSDYTNYGPNNEVYLAPGQAIAFNLDLSAFETYDTAGNLTKNTVASVQLGMKSANGSAVTYKIFDASTVDSADDLANVAAATIETASDMYYDIYSLRHKTIVIANTGSEGILSLTNIKLTFTEVPPAVTNLLYVSGETVGLVLKSLTEGVDPFEPEQFTVKCASSAYVGNKVIVTVNTSTDVAAITVNGTEYMTYFENRSAGVRYWTAKVDAEAAGDLAINVVAYDEEGNPSETVTKTVTVTDVSSSGNSAVTSIRKFINSLLGWLAG